MNLVFIDCNKAVSFDLLWPNFWSIFGYPRLSGHWKNGEIVDLNHAYIYFHSKEEWNKFQQMKRALAEKGWKYAYELTLEKSSFDTYKIVGVSARHRVCAAK